LPRKNVYRKRKVQTAQWKTSSDIQRRTKTDREAQSKLVFTHHREKICRYVEPVSDAIVKWETRNNVCVTERHGASRDTFLKASPEMEKITPSKSIVTHHRKVNVCRCVEYVSGAIVKWEPPNNICVGGSREASPNSFLRALSEKWRRANAGREAPSKSVFTHHREKSLCRCVESVSDAILK
jgi:hypothetical protein